MSYTAKNWEDNVSDVTASELNRMEAGIVAAHAQLIQVDDNLNNYTTDGNYFFRSGHTYTNAPTSTGGWLEVKGGASLSTTKQIWYTQGTSNNDYRTFIRTLIGGTWTDWKEMVTVTQNMTWNNIGGRVVIDTNEYTVSEKKIYANQSINLCYVHLNLVAVNANSADFASNLPKAPDSLSLSTMILNRNIPFYSWVNSAGVLKSHLSHQAGDTIRVTGCYPYTSL